MDEDRIPDEIQPPEQESVYTVFLIGDSGAPQLETKDPVLTLFEHFLEQANKNSAALFLGDNLYPAGLPDSSDPDRSYYEDRLKAQLNTVQNFKGKVIMVPGNHDWHDGGPEGLQRVREQERFVEEYLDRGNTFLPDDGFPGPVDLKLADEDKTGLPGDIRLLAIDTQWWLHGHEKPFGDTGEYDLHDGGDFLTEFDDLLKKRRKDFLIVAGHHPLITHDNHGGFLPPDIHWKPPVFGSLYALYRRVFGLPQDVNHHKYRQLSERLQEMMMLNDHLIYTSGHSHNLQYHVLRHPRTTQHFLVSGAGSKESYVAPGRGADFTYAGKGFMVLKFFKDGSIWMEAWAPDAESDRGKKLSVHLVKPATQEVLPPQEEQITSEISYQDSTYRTAARKDYDEKSWIFEALAGSHNRKYWSIETEFPVFDISTQKGGLVVDRLGGRGQSQTLHLKDKEGNKYVLRSVDKVAGKVWDEQLRNTIALDLVQDQFSIINPYAALVVPGLANAAGVFHTNPEVFYIPHDPRLGVYTDLVGGQLALFEEKPDGDMRHVESVGRSKKVLSHRQMIRAIEGDIDHRVVQEDFARARLFDMLISDWDRHFDQWRWASFEPEDKKGKLYRPIPRDRDVALMVMNGIGPTLAKWGPFYQYQNYDESYGNLRGMNANSIGLTRRFTNTLTRDEWIQIAETMQHNITDEVIEKAIRSYPPEVFEKYGEETIEIMKVRRDKLAEVTRRFYDMIASVVSVPGSNKRERYIIDVLPEKRMRVRVFKITQKGKQKDKYYDRTFSAGETKEIRLYGMGGADEFTIRGDYSAGIKLIVVGGPGEDVFTDKTTVRRIKKAIELFDTKTGNEIPDTKNTHVHTSANPMINAYDYEGEFKWNRIALGGFFNYNNDDGVFIGGGPRFIRHGFRKQPASVEHYIRGNLAPLTGAANIRYSGDWYQIVGNWNARVDADVFFPESYQNFFGLGNETVETQENREFYRARFRGYSFEPKLNTTIRQQPMVNYFAGTRLSIFNVDDDPDRVTQIIQEGTSGNPFDEEWFGSVLTGFSVIDVDNLNNPKQGYQFRFLGEMNTGIENTSANFARIETSLSVYYSARFFPQITFANRTDFGHNIGDFPFYRASTIGGRQNMRGLRGTRFAGRTHLATNTEARIELFDFYRYVLGGKVGINPFFDVGRVWQDGEQSRIWHYAVGSGVWLNVFDVFLINASYGIAEDSSLFTITTGFFF